MRLSKLWLETFFYIGAVILLYINQFYNWNGEYADSDNYFQALKLIDFINNPTFYEQKLMFSNYPFGEVSHWTRVTLYIWYILSLPFIAFYPVKLAVFYSGLLLTPIFFTSSIYFLLKATRYFLNLKFRFLFFLLLYVQANFMRTGLINRPDHHIIFVFLSALIFYLVVNFIKNREQKTIKQLAIVCSFALLTGAEGIFLYIALCSFLVLGYLFYEKKYEYIIKFGQFYAIGTTIWWLTNPCYEGYFYMDTGRISIFYVGCAWLIYLEIFCVKNIHNKLKQLLIVCLITSVCALVIYSLGWLQSPYDERIISILVNRITENKAIDLYTGSYPFMGLLLGILMFNKQNKNETYLYLILSLALYTFLNLFGIRFLAYSGMYSALLITMFLQQRLDNNKKVIFLVIFFVLLEYISFIINVFLGQLYNKPTPPPLNINVQELPEGSVVSDLFFAPYIVWYGNRPVLASPYHRNVEGIIDNHEILFSSDEQKVINLIKKHKVGSIYLMKTDEYYHKPEENCDKLYGKILSCKNYPNWLIPIDKNTYKIDYSRLP